MSGVDNGQDPWFLRCRPRPRLPSHTARASLSFGPSLIISSISASSLVDHSSCLGARGEGGEATFLDDLEDDALDGTKSLEDEPTEDHAGMVIFHEVGGL